MSINPCLVKTQRISIQNGPPLCLGNKFSGWYLLAIAQKFLSSLCRQEPQSQSRSGKYRNLPIKISNYYGRMYEISIRNLDLTWKPLRRRSPFVTPPLFSQRICKMQEKRIRLIERTVKEPSNTLTKSYIEYVGVKRVRELFFLNSRSARGDVKHVSNVTLANAF